MEINKLKEQSLYSAAFWVEESLSRFSEEYKFIGNYH